MDTAERSNDFYEISGKDGLTVEEVTFMQPNSGDPKKWKARLQDYTEVSSSPEMMGTNQRDRDTISNANPV